MLFKIFYKIYGQTKYLKKKKKILHKYASANVNIIRDKSVLNAITILTNL